MRSRLRAVLKEPLTHFLVVGALLAGLDQVGGRSGDTARLLVVDEGVRRELVDAYLHEHGRAPTEAELAPLVERWIDEEVLYREGLTRRLDRDDARVRQRVAASMEALLAAQHPVPPESEDEVRAYFDAHPERWAEDARLDFVHVFVAGTDAASGERAEGLRTQLLAGASAVGMGDTFSGGRHYRGRRLADLRESFGDTFVEGLDTEATGTWTLRRSRFGYHVVRVERRTAAVAADFERARPDVEHALHEQARAERIRREIRRLRERWQVDAR